MGRTRPDKRISHPRSEGSTELRASANAAISLLMADVIMRIGTTMLRKFVQNAFLNGRYGREAAREIIRKRSRSGELASIAIARIANSSLPGLALVGSGIAARLLYERGKARAAREAGLISTEVTAAGNRDT